MNKNLAIAGSGLLAFIALWEGVKLIPYSDVGGIRTVCAGHTQDVEERPYSPAECAALLQKDVTEHTNGVLAVITTPISQSELNAYSSFAYNVGVDAFSRSNLLKRLNSGDRIGACNELLRWNKAGGKVMRGLTKRREAERKLCLEGAHESQD